MLKLKLFVHDIQLKPVIKNSYFLPNNNISKTSDTYTELKNKMRLNAEALLNYMVKTKISFK